MKKYVFAGWSEKQWLKATPEEIKMAKKFYKTCLKSKQSKEFLYCDRPRVIVNVIGSLYFRYDNCDDSDWFSIKNSADKKGLQVNINRFNKLVTRNDMVLNEIKRLKKFLGLGKTKSEMENVEAIHDYICDITEYNHGDDAKGYAIYHVLFEKTGICCGYSETFKAICDYIGIECELLGTDTHEWNRVLIEDTWLYLDVTWNDDLNPRKYYMLDEKRFYAIHPMHTNVCRDVWNINP